MKALCACCLLFATATAFAQIPRDVVYDCPCRAYWIPDSEGSDEGKLTVEFGVRSHRPWNSGKLLLDTGIYNEYGYQHRAEIVDSLAGNAARAGLSIAVAYFRPEEGDVIQVGLSEVTFEDPEESRNHYSRNYHTHEWLSLWPVPGGGALRRDYVDILTDTDGDGTGDVNERLAGTDAADRSDRPAGSTVDVLTVYNQGALDLWVSTFGSQNGFYERIHHLMAVANTMYADSETRVRLRTVGTSRIEVDERGWMAPDVGRNLKSLHGADVVVQFHGGPNFGCGAAGGCAGVGSYRDRGHWREAGALVHMSTYAWTIAHELGHVMGLAHSARQGEDYGAFRWSRGHTYGHDHQIATTGGWRGFIGTIMAWGGEHPHRRLTNAFSDPSRDCGFGPCGSPPTERDGADAVRTLDLVRFQVAAHNEAERDRDGDGFVDPVDAAPDDPGDWSDQDGDGVADNADDDDDNDGVEDAVDRFPLDPGEWEDIDGDGVGDNADGEVADLGPFRDPALRAVVEEALGKPEGAQITAGDMETLVSLEARDRGIRDLTGLELATGLTDLLLESHGVTDLTPLSGLTALKELALTYGPIIDVEPLSELGGLERLDLTGNEIRDLSPLSGLEELVHLELKLNSITDVRPLAGLRGLRTLGLRLNERLSDLAGLSGLGAMRSLDLSYNDIADLSELSGLQAIDGISLHGNRISDLAPLSGMTGLRQLGAASNEVSDLSPLSGLTRLETLTLDDNEVSDLRPVGGLGRLLSLGLRRNRIADISPLAGLGRLRWLLLDGNSVADISALSPLAGLETLDLGDNAVADLSPLARIGGLRFLRLDRNNVADLTPLHGNRTLAELAIGWNPVTVADVVALPRSRQLTRLGLAGLGVADVSPLRAFGRVERLDLRDNEVADIGPLVDRSLWAEAGRRAMHLQGNPLGEESVVEHIPMLESWGVRVGHDHHVFGETAPSPAVHIPDATLRSAVGEALTYSLVREPVTVHRISFLRTLFIARANIADLTGLELAENLSTLHAASNRISDLSALASLAQLRSVDLSGNLISDLSPLAENAHLDSGDVVALSGNPLSEESLNRHVPALLAQGVRVVLESIAIAMVVGQEATFDVTGYLRARLGDGVEVDAVVSDPTVASAVVEGGVVRLAPGAAAGSTTVTLTATNGSGEVVTLVMEVAVSRFRTDHGDSAETATLLPIGPPLPGTVGEADDVDYFRIDLQGSATLEVRTSGPTDTRGELFDGAGVLLASDDDSGPGGRNFRVREDLAAGIYYVGVAGEPGDYAVMARLGDAPDHGETGATATLLTLYAEEDLERVSPSVLLATPGRIAPTSADVDAFRLDVPLAATDVTIRSAGGTDVFGRLLDASLTELAADASDGNFRIEARLDAGTYYVVVGGTETGTYRVLAWGESASCACAATTAGDDGGDAESSTLMPIGPPLAGTIDDASDVDYFRIDLQGRATLEVRTSGPTDTRGELLDGTGARLLSDDDGGPGGHNFSLRAELEAGIYYVAVAGEPGDYAVMARLGDSPDHGGTAALSTLLTLYEEADLERVSPSALLAAPGKISPDDADVDVFRLDVPMHGTDVTIRSAGGTDVVGRLVDPSSNVIAADESTGNFRIEATLDAGIYYVTVEGREVGTYRVLAWADAADSCRCGDE